MAYYGQQTFNYTVDSFLQAAGTCRSRKHSPNPGYQWDHIVELQLVVAAVNRLPTSTYQRAGWQNELAHFFKREENYQQITANENQTKGQAVTRRITGSPAYSGDAHWIYSIKNTWSSMRQTLVGMGHGRFATAMDELLR